MKNRVQWPVSFLDCRWLPRAGEGDEEELEEQEGDDETEMEELGDAVRRHARSPRKKTD